MFYENKDYKLFLVHTQTFFVGNELVKFYKSPLGQKSLQLLPEMTNAGSRLGKKYAEKYSENFKEKLTRIMKKYPRE